MKTNKLTNLLLFVIACLLAVIAFNPMAKPTRVEAYGESQSVRGKQFRIEAVEAQTYTANPLIKKMSDEGWRPISIADEWQDYYKRGYLFILFEK